EDLDSDVGETQKLISLPASPEDLDLDVEETQKLISLPASLKDLDPDVGEMQEPLLFAYENDDAPTVMSLVALPKELDPHGNFGIQQRFPNFFLLGSSSHAQVASAQRSEHTSQGNGSSGKDMQVVVTALDILARSETPLTTHAAPTSAGENNKEQHS